MRLRPRQELLEIWHGLAKYSVSGYDPAGWCWDGRDGRNSISDAEQLLCLMIPATQLAPFKLDEPDETAEDVLTALRPLGDAVETPRFLIRLFTDYFDRYRDADGTPVFSGSTYFRSTRSGPEPTDQQRSIDIVESYAVSVRLTLAVIGFVRILRNVVRNPTVRMEIDRLEQLSSNRLSAAMVGLLRSFTLSTFEADSVEGRALIDTANQGRYPLRRIVHDVRAAMRETIAAFREMTVGSGQHLVEELDNPYRLFECGWSWGVVKDAPTVETAEDIGKQPDGVAIDRPFLYFTVVAAEAIQEMFAERTRILGLLNEEQQRLSRALQLRWDLTRSYWATLAMLGDTGRWPLEDIPWRTTDGAESDYLSLLVTCMTVDDLASKRGSDAELSRLGEVLAELAKRGRITRRPFLNDPALTLHVPGVPIPLWGSETIGGAQLQWLATDFAPLLLRQVLRIAGLVNNTESRTGLLDLADSVWEHLAARRLAAGTGRGLWDQPAQVFPEVGVSHEPPSWRYTTRVVTSLVAAAQVLFAAPVRSVALASFALELLTEAEHLFDQELVYRPAGPNERLRSTFTTISASLRRAREIVHDRPGTAATLATEVLRSLDELAVARRVVRAE